MHDNPFQLLVATILSAQCTDARVNLVTPKLFKQFPDAPAFANADEDDIQQAIKSINFFRNKAKNIKKMAQSLIENHNAVVPNRLSDLTALSGVGRKTANVVLGQAFDQPGITVDTHVRRLTRRMGFTKNNDPVKIEHDLMKLWPKEIWTPFSSVLILHGRTTCKSQNPRCNVCEVAQFCPKIGV